MWWLGGRAACARLAACASLSCLVLAGPVHAAEPEGTNLSRAHDAYTRGAAAYEQRDYARAARELSMADALVPDPVTLRAALDAVRLADDPVLGAELLARASRAPQDALLAAAVSAARARFAHRTGAVVVRCDGCLVMVDGAPVGAGEPHVVLPGVHTVTIQRGTAPEPRLVSVAADETLEVLGDPTPTPRPSDPLRPAAPLAKESGGVSPGWFVGAAGVSFVLGVLTIGSGAETVSEHSKFDRASCGTTGGSGCSGLQSTGQSYQTATMWLGIGTGVAVAGTTLLGALGVRWHRAKGHDVGLQVSGSTAVVGVAF
jgi:hypothetical protein